MLPSRLGVGGNVQSSDVCIYFIGCFNRMIVHACVLYGMGLWTLTHEWTIAQGKSVGFGCLCYFQFTVNLVTSFVFITLP